MSSGTLDWRGIVTSVQPRIRLTRSFDERQHTYLGYLLLVDGVVGDDRREFYPNMFRPVMTNIEGGITDGSRSVP